ncbi:transporter substrate-binding domain-containing protein [Rhodoligotrophos ferricapiens]|uniref:transporter substrate-binding domain-containing protein n=1 Tax=Rhodoligotrophos ferricapiens TaxID=3069264 RepID=UPI00315DEF5F
MLAWASLGIAAAQQRGEEVERTTLPPIATQPTESQSAPPDPATGVEAKPEQPKADGGGQLPGNAAQSTGANPDGKAPAATGSTGGGTGTANTAVATPYIWRLDASLNRPDLAGRPPIKILVGNDYPPFNYVDRSGALAGFNVDLARAMCLVLRVQCSVTAVAWDELVPSLLNGAGDALVASVRITPAALASVDFTKPYFRLPARFAVSKASGIKEADSATLAGKRIGVVRGTAHEAYLAAFFQRSVIRLYGNEAEALDALRAEEIDAVFGDGTALMFWTLGESSQNCCELADGAYTEAHYFGNGAGIAVRRGDTPLRKAFEYAMDQLKTEGTYDMLVRKYFPVNLY